MWNTLVLLWSPKFVDTNLAEKAAIAKTATTKVITAIANNHRRLDVEHRVHVCDRDGEYPFLHTEQSASGAHKREGGWSGD